MKVQKTQEKVFTPVQLNITFETKEEYKVFRELVFWNKTITCTIYTEQQQTERVILQDMMQQILGGL